MSLYVFEPSIFDALEKTPFGKGNELQLTDGFKKLIEKAGGVKAIKLRPDEVRWDIGTSRTCWDALRSSYRFTEEE